MIWKGKKQSSIRKTNVEKFKKKKKGRKHEIINI